MVDVSRSWRDFGVKVHRIWLKELTEKAGEQPLSKCLTLGTEFGAWFNP